MSTPEDPLSGVKTFSIGGRMIHERERCMGMTHAERTWRAQFLKDQILSHDEPRFVPEYYKDTTNIFRRLWKTPMMRLENVLVKKLGEKTGLVVRHYIGKTGIMIGLATVVYYYFKYHANDWTAAHGAEYFVSRGVLFPQDPGYPNYYENTHQDYYGKGFYSSVLCKKELDKSKN